MGRNEERRVQSVEEVGHMVAVLGERVDALRLTVDRTYETVAGNGRPGLGERVALLEAWRERVEYWTTLLLRPLLPIGMMLLGLGAVISAVVYVRAHLL